MSESWPMTYVSACFGMDQTITRRLQGKSVEVVKYDEQGLRIWFDPEDGQALCLSVYLKDGGQTRVQLMAFPTENSGPAFPECVSDHALWSVSMVKTMREGVDDA